MNRQPAQQRGNTPKPPRPAKAPAPPPVAPRVLHPVGGKRFMVEKGAGGGSFIVEK